MTTKTIIYRYFKRLGYPPDTAYELSEELSQVILDNLKLNLKKQ